MKIVCGFVLAVSAAACGQDEGSPMSATGSSDSDGSRQCPVTNVSSSPGECHLESDCEAMLLQVDCTGTDEAGYACTCKVGQEETGTFTSPSCATGMPSESFLTRVNGACGWSLTP